MAARKKKKKVTKRVTKKKSARRSRDNPSHTEVKPQRLPNGHFAPGNNLNPGGRPKKNREIEALAQELLEAESKPGRHVVLDRMIKIVKHGRPPDAIPAGKLLMEYAYGRPRQRVEVDPGSGTTWADLVRSAVKQ